MRCRILEVSHPSALIVSRIIASLFISPAVSLAIIVMGAANKTTTSDRVDSSHSSQSVKLVFAQSSHTEAADRLMFIHYEVRFLKAKLLDKLYIIPMNTRVSIH